MVLMPGLDGSGTLFAPLRAVLPEALRVQTVAYPGDLPMGYSELLPWLDARLPQGPYVLVAESFSGPLALLHAARRPPRCRGLVLSASFCRNPAPWGLTPLLRCMGARIFARDLPSLLMRGLMVGWDASTELLEMVRAATAEQDPLVLAHRWREVLALDLGAAPGLVELPCLCLWGTRDKVVGRRGLRGLQARLPGLEVVAIQAPHLLLQARPAEAWAAMQPYLQRQGVLGEAGSPMASPLAGT